MEGFEINKGAGLEQSIRTLLKGRISAIEEQVLHQEDIHTGIHETRRSVKRIRAILKMIRDEIGFSSYYRENLFYRDLARRLAPARDSYVLLQTLEALQEKEEDLLPSNTFNDIKGLINRQIDEDLLQYNMEWGGMGQLLEELSGAAGRIDRFCQLRDGFISIRKGIRRIYRRGRRQQSRIHEAFQMEAFHEYRKNSKYMQFQMELLRPLFMKILKAYSGALDNHTEQLGEIRDVGRLLNYLKGMTAVKIPAGTRKRLHGRILQYRNGLLNTALEQSSAIYAEKPGELIRRLDTYWKHGYQLYQ